MSRNGPLSAPGSYNTPKDVHGSYRGGTIGASPAYSFTAHVAEVHVDVTTGVVTVDKIWVAHDCGRAINPVLVECQMEGSTYMGFAEALMEEQIFKSSDEGRAGLHNAPSLLDYRIPTSLDTPEMKSLIIESIDPGDCERNLRCGWHSDGCTAVQSAAGVEGVTSRGLESGMGPGAGRQQPRRCGGGLMADRGSWIADRGSCEECVHAWDVGLFSTFHSRDPRSAIHTIRTA